MRKLAVIMFPGTNCENETVRAVKATGMIADKIRWNDTSKLKEYDGYVIAGGWSYEDRIRAGVIAAKDKIMDTIKEEASSGKIVLGICNGCQVLAETGIIPAVQDRIEIALAPNINPYVSGFYCTWVNVKNSVKRKTAFNLTMEPDEIIKIPIAHGEGRFTTKDQNLVPQLLQHDQLQFRYCDSAGNFANNFPINPNGSMINIAGIVNKEGNVLAMMPHPERAAWQRQVPEEHKDGELAGPGRKIFESIKRYLK